MNANDGMPNDATWPQRLLAALCWALAAVAFGVTSWLYGLQPLAIAVGNWKLALDYSDVEAKVVTRTRKAPDGTAVSWLAASYEVNGKTYFAERLSVLDDDSLDEAYNNRVLGWLETAQRGNRPINVHVSPRHPEIALVSNDFPLPSLMSRAPLAMGFTLLAGVGLLGAIGAVCNFGYYGRLRKYWKSWAVVATLCAIIFPLMLQVGTDADSGEFTVDVAVFFTAIAGLVLSVLLHTVVSDDEAAGATEAEGPAAKRSVSARHDTRSRKR